MTDTDSVPYIVDTNANRIVLKDASMMTGLKVTFAKIKGIGDKGGQISGTVKISLPLKPDNGDVDIIIHLNSFYVPSSP